MNLLWEKDFAYIRCVAPDEYLEAKISSGEEFDLKVPRGTFLKAKIELKTEDKEELSRVDLISQSLEMEPERLKELDQTDDFSSLNEKEARILKFMLETNRKISTEEELFFLILEMLYLEEDGTRFAASLDDLTHSYQDVIKKGNFYLANQILNYIIELRQSLLTQSEENVKFLDKFIQTIKNREFLDSMKEPLLRGDVSDYKSFFDYLNSLGPEMISFLGEIYDGTKSADFRLQAQKLLKEISEKDFTALIGLTQENRPALTKEVIAILGELEDNRTIQFLADFISSKDKSIKRITIDSLGKIKDEKVPKILLSFLADEDENLRISACQKLRYFGDSSILKPVMKIAERKTFKKKSREEKQAFLDFLGRSKNQEACEFLQAIIKKSSFFRRSKHNETRLCAISSLEKMGTPEAFQVLNEGMLSRTKKIREACRLALNRLSENQEDIIN